MSDWRAVIITQMIYTVSGGTLSSTHSLTPTSDYKDWHTVCSSLGFLHLFVLAFDLTIALVVAVIAVIYFCLYSACTITANIQKTTRSGNKDREIRHSFD